jgi:hypothetical protein
VKHIKMELLALVANDANTSEIVTELAEYVSDVNADMARHAIRSIAQVPWPSMAPLDWQTCVCVRVVAAVAVRVA